MNQIKKTISFPEALMELKKNLQDMVEAQPTLAIITRAKYEALKQAGFSEDQAIKLCKQ